MRSAPAAPSNFCQFPFNSKIGRQYLCLAYEMLLLNDLSPSEPTDTFRAAHFLRQGLLSVERRVSSVPCISLGFGSIRNSHESPTTQFQPAAASLPRFASTHIGLERRNGVLCCPQRTPRAHIVLAGWVVIVLLAAGFSGFLRVLYRDAGWSEPRKSMDFRLPHSRGPAV